MKKLMLVLLALNILLSFTACGGNINNDPENPSDTESPATSVSPDFTHAPLNETTAPPETPAEVKAPDPIVYTDDYGVTYSPVLNEDILHYTISVNGKAYDLDLFTKWGLKTHFYLNGDTLYVACTNLGYAYSQKSPGRYYYSLELYTGELPLDGRKINISLKESYTEKNVSEIAGMFSRLNEISPRWSNPSNQSMDFIACGSFISENCYNLTDEDYELMQIPPYSCTFQENDELQQEIYAAHDRADKIYEDYALFITPENINELSKLDGAAVRNLYCWLSEDGLDLLPLTKIKTYVSWGSYSYSDRTYVYVNGVPKSSDFLKMINDIENFNGRLSYLDSETTGFYNCNVIIDTDYLPIFLYMSNCNVTLEKPLSGRINSLSFYNCAFDKAPDFSGITFTPYVSSPFNTDNLADFTFNCPGQKATGFGNIQYEAETAMRINGDIDIPDFSFLRMNISDHVIQSAGKVNIDDLIENNDKYKFRSIRFIDCTTKNQFDELKMRYPDKRIIVEIDGVEYDSKPE